MQEPLRQLVEQHWLAVVHVAPTTPQPGLPGIETQLVAPQERVQQSVPVAQVVGEVK